MTQQVVVNERLAALTAAGTSIWLDQIRRGLIESGELQRLVDEYSLRGVTSNPAIFEKAILGSTDYDEDIEQLASQGLGPKEIYEQLAITDVQLAAEVLRPVYDDSRGVDGYVSLEVEPALAHDTEGTLEQARDLWKRVDAPNVMIKIPGTDEGLPAIEQAIAEGINVNVTLLFSVEAYERVIEAFIKGSERAEGGEYAHSVASFFVSRVDTEVDKRLPDDSPLRGTAAVANARAAYQRFKEIFQGERFAELRDSGLPGAAAAVGVDRRQGPQVPRDQVRGRAGRAGHREHDADAHAAGRGGAGRGSRRHGGPGPERRAPGARRRGHRHEGRDRQAAARRHRGVRDSVRPADRRRGAGARGGRDGQAEDDPVGDPRRARARAGRAREGRDRRGRGQARLAAKDESLWGGPGVPGDRRPAGLAHDQREDAGRGARAERVRGGDPLGGLHGRRAARHGRLEPRPRGDPPLVRRHRGLAEAARARLDRPGRGARARARPSTSRRRSSSCPRSRAARSRRSRT